MVKTTKIKILYTIPNFDTAGSGKVVYDLVKHIDRLKFEPHICCTHNKGGFFKTVESLNVSIHIFPFYANYYPLFSLPARINKIRKFFKEHQFDIIHSWHWSSDFTEPLAAKLAGIPFVYTKKAMGWGNRAWKWRSKLSTKIIVLNKDMIEKFFRPRRDKIVEIPLGLSLKEFNMLDKSYHIKKSVSFDESDFVIISIANLVEIKGLEILLEAVKRINNFEIKVVIVGDNTSLYAERLMKKYTDADNVFFIDKQHNIKPYLALSDVFVIPTLKKGEGQPIAPLEAMLSGRVVIGSNVAGIRDILKPFPDLLFASESVEDLKLKIEEFINLSRSKRIEMANRLYNHAVKNYNLQDSMSKHENLYKNLVK